MDAQEAGRGNKEVETAVEVNVDPPSPGSAIVTAAVHVLVWRSPPLVHTSLLQRRSKQLSDQRTGSVGGKSCGRRLAPCREIRSTLERHLN